jgi:hypothetical protein
VARSDGGRAVTSVAQRHWGGASRCDPATDLAFPQPFEPPRRGLSPRLPLLVQGGEPLREPANDLFQHASDRSRFFPFFPITPSHRPQSSLPDHSGFLDEGAGSSVCR